MLVSMKVVLAAMARSDLRFPMRYCVGTMVNSYEMGHERLVARMASGTLSIFFFASQKF